MNVLLLGAGASKSYSQSRTNLRMPIAKDFFSTFRELSLSENPWVLTGDILNVARDDWGIEPIDFFDSDINIENFHSYVEQKLLEALPNWPADVQYWKAYNQLIFLFSSVVNEIQNGPVSNAHIKIGESLSTENVILTFNWDTLMDRALQKTQKWKPDYGYFVNPKNIFRDGWDSHQPTATNDSPLLIKLHGSSNWITSHLIPHRETKEITLTQSATPDTLFIYEYATKPYPTYQGRYMAAYEPFSYGYYPPNLDDIGKKPDKGKILFQMTPQFPWYPEKTSESTGLTSMPLIIPPVKKKTYGLFGQLFQSLWQKAEDSLVHAENIMIIGYSFPQTDLQSNDLFLRAFSRRKKQPKVSIIDPLPDRIVHKFKFEFGVSEINVFREYYTEDFDLNQVF